MDSPGVWNGRDTTISTSQDDFQNFLSMDLGNLGNSLHFDFGDFDAEHTGQMMQDSVDAMDTHMENSGVMHDAMVTMASHPSIPGTTMAHNSAHTSNDDLVALDAQIQYLQQQRQHQQERAMEEQRRNFYAQSHNRMVPPTPNSIEMHGQSSGFYGQSGQQQQHHQKQQQQQQVMYERFGNRVREAQDMAFTPLVSPAVTPLESNFPIPEYTGMGNGNVVPGVYFSPLSSPALHAQNEHRAAYEARRQDTATTNSPGDISEILSAPPSGGLRPKTNAKKPARKTPNTRAGRPSPIEKPLRRKAGSSTNIPAQALSDIVEPPHSQDPSRPATSANSVASTEGSENASVSPEHLSDMAPPPLPSSAKLSPMLTGSDGQAKPVAGQGLAPATPASLMRIAKSTNGNQKSSATTAQETLAEDEEMGGGFSLPEAVNPTRPSLARIDTQSTGELTPKINSAPSSKPRAFQPLPSPAFARPSAPASTTQSPQLNAITSPNSIANPGTPHPGTPSAFLRKTPQLSAQAQRNSKKRGSVSSVHVSPALRPRISPSIKPLLPGSMGPYGDDSASMLLATKSNYQNILEGTNLPGVSYPAELSTNLTSKRTSHKIAEQGRRNRINSALQEIATLLPSRCSVGKDKDSGKESGDGDEGGADGSEKKDGGKEEGKGGKEGKAQQSANSKASTVEFAIEYIKQLKQELKDAKEKVESLEKKLAEVESGGGGGGGAGNA